MTNANPQNDELKRLRDLIHKGLPVVVDQGRIRVPLANEEVERPSSTQTITVKPHTWG
jgi:hypothetical protein